MQSIQNSRKLSRLAVVLSLLTVFVAGFIYFWTNTNGPMPFAGAEPYSVAFRANDIKNLKDGGDVTIAGVLVGRVEDRTIKNGLAHVEMQMSPEAAPLHQGATVQVTLKGLTGTSEVQIIDGNGAPIPAGAVLAPSAVKPAVDIDEVISMLSDKTRKSLGVAIRSLGKATDGTSEDISTLMSGLGKLGRQGHTALDAIAAQSRDLAALARDTTTVLDALDTGRGQIATVVRDAQRLTEATAGQRAAIEATMRALPGVVASANDATGKLHELAGPLTPVAADLKATAPKLNAALLQLPAVTEDLRGLLPALNGTLDAAPATLDRLPVFGSDVRELIPATDALLCDVNPMLAYLKPYGRDIGAMFANFAGILSQKAEDGVRPARLYPVVNSGSVRGNPLSILELDPTHWTNPYPAPGSAGDPEPYSGKYPRVECVPK